MKSYRPDGNRMTQFVQDNEDDLKNDVAIAKYSLQTISILFPV